VKHAIVVDMLVKHSVESRVTVYFSKRQHTRSLNIQMLLIYF